MKTKKHILLAFSFLLSVAFLSCQKDIFIEVPPQPQSGNAMLQGLWQWTETKGSIQIADATPRSAGFEVSLNILDTIITVCKDGILVASGGFQIKLWDGTSCSPDELLEDGFLLQVSSDFNLAVSLATNAKITIPMQSVVSFEENNVGELFMNLHENSCGGFSYIFRKIQ